MKARFFQKQPPVKIIEKDNTAYVYICQDETEGYETYPDMEEGRTELHYYEYNYNEIIAPIDALPIEDMQDHPENYIYYTYKPEILDPGRRALEEIEKLKMAIERGVNT